MEAIARDKINFLKNKFFKKENTGYHVTSREENFRLFDDNGAPPSGDAPQSSGSEKSDTEDEENKTVGKVLQKFSDLKSRLFNKSEYASFGSGSGNQEETSTVSSDEEAEVGFRGHREISRFKQNFQKLKNKLFKDTDSLDGYEQTNLIHSDWLTAGFNSPIRGEDTGAGAQTLTGSRDVRDFFANDSDSGENDGRQSGNGAPPESRLNFFDSCVEDEDDDTEIELFSLPAEKCEWFMLSPKLDRHFRVLQGSCPELWRTP